MRSNRHNLITVFTVICTILVAAGFYWYQQTRGVADATALQNKQAEAEETAVVPEKGEVEVVEGGTKRYTSEHYGFSFQIPAEFTVGEFDEAGGRVVLVQSGTGDTSFQIFISPYDEPAESLTPERIKKDLPSLQISNPEPLNMTGDSRALSFVGSDPAFGQTREVWMVNSGNLYQIMTYVSAQDFLADVLNTWEFI